MADFEALYEHIRDHTTLSLEIEGDTRAVVLANTQDNCPAGYRPIFIFHKTSGDSVWFRAWGWEGKVEKYLPS